MSTEAVHASPFFLRILLLWQPSRSRAAIDRALSADGRVRSRLVRCSSVGVLVTQVMSDPRDQEDARETESERLWPLLRRAPNSQRDERGQYDRP